MNAVDPNWLLLIVITVVGSLAASIPAWITLAQARARAGVAKIEKDTATQEKRDAADTAKDLAAVTRENLVTQIAHDGLETLKLAASAKIQAVESKAMSDILKEKVSGLEKANERLERQITDNDTAYKMQIDTLNAQIVALQERVDKLTVQGDDKDKQIAAKDKRIAALETELAVLRSSPGEPPRQQGTQDESAAVKSAVIAATVHTAAATASAVQSAQTTATPAPPSELGKTA